MMEVYKNLSLENLYGEIWKEIDEYDGDYFVSNLGRVKSFKRYKDGKILKQGEDTCRYLIVGLYKNRKRKPKRIHTLMYENFNNIKIPEGYVVHHKDFTKNNRLDNFQFMTDKEHKQLHHKGENNPMFGNHHSEKTLELMRGENSSNSILKNQDIIEIRKLCDEEILTQIEIGKIFGVNPATISLIKLRKIWKHI